MAISVLPTASPWRLPSPRGQWLAIRAFLFATVGLSIVIGLFVYPRQAITKSSS